MLGFVDNAALIERVGARFGPESAAWLEGVLEMMAGGGFVMWPLVILGALLWYALGVRAATLRRGSPFPLARMVSSARKSPDKNGHGIIGQAVAFTAG